jgi:outer membrane lipoprotein SlyB
MEGGLWLSGCAWSGKLFRPGSGRRTVVAADHGAFARAVHGQCVEQTDQGKEAVHLATLSADDREPAVLALESPERLDEHVHSSRVHERDLGQIHDGRTRLALE